MKLVKTDDGQIFGPFQTAEALIDRIIADGLEFPFTTLQNPKIVDAPDGYESPPPIPTVKDYTDAVQKQLDDEARARNYDSILSACSYATSTNPRFSAEGQACVAWRDAVWAECYTILGLVQAGQRTPPTIPELLAALPVMTWPVV